MSDLETSILIAQAFVDATPENDPGRVPPLQNLGTGFQELFLKTGSMTYLEKAIQFGQAAADAAKNLLCPSDQVICLNCLAVAHHVETILIIQPCRFLLHVPFLQAHLSSLFEPTT